MKNLIQALIQAKKRFPPIRKSGKANAGKYSYKFAPLPDILAAIEPALLDCGLFLSTPSVMVDGKQYVKATLYHESGEVLEGSLYPVSVPAPKENVARPNPGHAKPQGSLYPVSVPKENEPQKVGIGFSYARRYAILGLLNLAPDEDEDGAIISSATVPSNSNGRGGGATEGQIRLLYARAKEKNLDREGLHELLGVSSLKDLSRSDVDPAIDKINKYEGGNLLENKLYQIAENRGFEREAVKMWLMDNYPSPLSVANLNNAIATFESINN